MLWGHRGEGQNPRVQSGTTPQGISGKGSDTMCRSHPKAPREVKGHSKLQHIKELNRRQEGLEDYRKLNEALKHGLTAGP